MLNANFAVLKQEMPNAYNANLTPALNAHLDFILIQTVSVLYATLPPQLTKTLPLAFLAQLPFLNASLAKEYFLQE